GLAVPAIVQAEGTYPNRLVRYINPYPAGGPTDTLSRLFCARMTELTGQQWVVENRALSRLGAGDPGPAGRPDPHDVRQIPGMLTQSRAGKVRPLGVTSTKCAP